MTTTATRKQRGAKTQSLVADYFVGHGWPYATDAGAGRSGCDVLGVPGLAIEVKARNGFNVVGWLAQAAKYDGLPMCVIRPNGIGPARIDSWPVLMRLGDVVGLLRAAGYGTPNTDG